MEKLWLLKSRRGEALGTTETTDYDRILWDVMMIGLWFNALARALGASALPLAGACAAPADQTARHPQAISMILCSSLYSSETTVTGLDEICHDVVERPPFRRAPDVRESFIGAWGVYW